MEWRRKFFRFLRFSRIVVLVVIIELVGELLGLEVCVSGTQITIFVWNQLIDQMMGPEAPVEGRYFLIGPVLSWDESLRQVSYLTSFDGFPAWPWLIGRKSHVFIPLGRRDELAAAMNGDNQGVKGCLNGEEGSLQVVLIIQSSGRVLVEIGMDNFCL